IRSAFLAEDREIACIYAEAGLPEYWLFNLYNSTVEVSLKPSGERYSEMKTYSRNEILSPLFSSQIKLDLSTVFL
ncbi:MAG TPA: Uma2 family endonuclease, partial [Leptospiraceae bacterium]|nr:Uma2 family endonuclease [Leptospiraceae bacterium]